MQKKQQKILIVDDSNTNVVLLEAILKNRGYYILTACSVRQAITVLGSELPQLILLDLLMPKEDGYFFLQRIKEKEETKNIPVIIVSAVREDEHKKKPGITGAIDYIEKPVDIPSLIKKVENRMPHQ